jgi:hypothetical protein
MMTAKVISNNEHAQLAIFPRSHFVERFTLTEHELSV